MEDQTICRNDKHTYNDFLTLGIEATEIVHIANSLSAYVGTLLDATIFMMARLLTEEELDYFWNCKRQATNNKELLEIIEKLANNVKIIQNSLR